MDMSVFLIYGRVIPKNRLCGGIPSTAAALYGIPSSYCKILCSIRNATGNEYMTEPATMPPKPSTLMLSPSRFAKIPEPFTPIRAFNPYACDMDGMSIGMTKSMEKTPLPRMSVRQSENDAPRAKSIEMTVAVSAVVTELIIDGTKSADEVSDLKLCGVMRVNIVIIGAITTYMKNSAMNTCITVRVTFLFFII